MALSAIEIYNKPDFKGREQVFCILMVTAWEALLKARIVQQSGSKLNAIYVKYGQRYKRNRTGAYFTIGIDEAIRRCKLPLIVEENISRLVDIRDAAIHLTADSHALPYLVFTLSTASLQNYARFIRAWFQVGLGDYNFYILPLGFSIPFQAITAVDFQKEPKAVAAVIASIAAAQDECRISEDGFHLLCEIKTQLVSVKKVTEDPDLVAAVKSGDLPNIIVRRDVNILDQYPFTYTQIWERIRDELPQVRRFDFNEFIRINKIKGNKKFSRYNYRSKLEEKRGSSKNTAVVYNAEFLNFALTELGRITKS